MSDTRSEMTDEQRRAIVIETSRRLEAGIRTEIRRGTLRLAADQAGVMAGAVVSEYTRDPAIGGEAQRIARAQIAAAVFLAGDDAEALNVAKWCGSCARGARGAAS